VGQSLTLWLLSRCYAVLGGRLWRSLGWAARVFATCYWLSSVVVGVCEHHQPLRGFPCAPFSLEQGEDEGFELEVGGDGALVTNDDVLSLVCPHHLL